MVGMRALPTRTLRFAVGTALVALGGGCTSTDDLRSNTGRVDHREPPETPEAKTPDAKTPEAKTPPEPDDHVNVGPEDDPAPKPEPIRVNEGPQAEPPKYAPNPGPMDEPIKKDPPPTKTPEPTKPKPTANPGPR